MKHKKGKANIKYYLIAILLLMGVAWIVYQKFFAYDITMNAIVSRELGTDITSVEFSYGGNHYSFYSEEECRRFLEKLKEIKLVERKNKNENKWVSYEKESFYVVLHQGEKCIQMDQVDSMKSERAIRVSTDSDIMGYYMANVNPVGFFEEFIQGREVFRAEDVIKLIDSENKAVKQDVKLRDFDSYGQRVLVEGNEKVCLQITLDNGWKMHVFFDEKELDGESNPTDLIVFKSATEYMSVTQKGFMEYMGD